jgi:predicted  nucleic acid-binding Zn-ribbon protein
MPTPVEIVRELSRLHRHAGELEEAKEHGPKLLKAQQGKLTRHENAVREAQENLKKLKVNIHEKEVSLKAMHQAVAKHEKQLDEAGGKKEYDALQTEIAAEKQKCAALEDEILAGLGEVDEKTAQIPQLEKSLAQVKVETANFDRDERERQDRVAKELETARGQLAEAEKQLPAENKSVYDRLVAAHGADAIAAIRDNTCSHCYNSITVQQQRELHAGRFSLCKSCGRIVYPTD